MQSYTDDTTVLIDFGICPNRRVEGKMEDEIVSSDVLEKLFSDRKKMEASREILRKPLLTENFRAKTSPFSV